jgi:hypothetical protein
MFVCIHNAARETIRAAAQERKKEKVATGRKQLANN